MKNCAQTRSLRIVALMPIALLLPLIVAACGSDVTTSPRPDGGATGNTGGGGSGGGNGEGGNGGTGGEAMACKPGAVEACYTGLPATVGVGACKAGTQICLENGSGYSDCVGEVVPAPEACNGMDDDCNGNADDGVLVTYYADGDNDGFGNPLEMVAACAAPNGFVINSGDCDDANPEVNPNGYETPNGYDDNCNGELNEDVYFASCKAILASLPASPSGPYTIDPDGPIGNGMPFEVSCDMNSNGGGWTLLAKNIKGGGLTGTIQVWKDILSQNFFFAGDFATYPDVPAGYLANTDFFAILRAAADLTFSEVRLNDNANISVQNLAAPKTLRMIHTANATEPLYKAGMNTGVLLLLGNAAHTGAFPCYYPTLDGLGCQEFYQGDNGNTSTAFYVGDLSLCAAGPAAGASVAALWGSHDCYAVNSSGGIGGFTFHRPAHVDLGAGGTVETGFNSGDWTIQVR